MAELISKSICEVYMQHRVEISKNIKQQRAYSFASKFSSRNTQSEPDVATQMLLQLLQSPRLTTQPNKRHTMQSGTEHKTSCYSNQISQSINESMSFIIRQHGT